MTDVKAKLRGFLVGTAGDPLDKRVEGVLAIVEKPLATYTVLPDVPVREKQVEAEVLTEVLETFELIDSETADQAGSLLKEVHGELQKLEISRKAAKAPALEAGRDIDAFFRPVIGAWQGAKTALTRKLTAYTRQLEAARAKAVAEAAAAAQARDTPAVEAALAQVKAPSTTQGTMQRTSIEVVVVDAALVPREYLMVDMASLKALARTGGKAPSGVTFTVATRVQVGR